MKTTYPPASDLHQRQRFKWSSVFFVGAGFFPLSVGSFFYVLTMRDQWKGIHSTAVYLAQITYANLMATGLSCIVVGYWGIRSRRSWCWWLLFFLFFWVGVNDTYATTSAYFEGVARFGPVPAIPTILGIAGLFLSRELAFQRSRRREDGASA